MAEMDHLWNEPYEELARWCGTNALPGSPTAAVAEAVLAARLALQQVEAARAAADAATASAAASRTTARATWWLVAATWALAIVTIAIALGN